jgi:hypothetical protein
VADEGAQRFEIAELGWQGRHAATSVNQERNE